MMDMTRRYRCPSCGDIITEEEYQDMIECEGHAWCYCEYVVHDEERNPIYLRILNKYVPIDDPTDCTPGEMQAAMLLDAIRNPGEYNPHEDGNYIIRLAERIEKERRSRWYIK